MKKAYDFSKGRRGAPVQTTGKTRITIYLDDDILGRFREEAGRRGIGYQTLINEALKASVGLQEKSLTVEAVRRIVREEIEAAS
jgi:uncharacterized protein (DUF4415 family)